MSVVCSEVLSLLAEKADFGNINLQTGQAPRVCAGDGQNFSAKDSSMCADEFAEINVAK